MVARAIHNTAGTRGSCCVISWHTRAAALAEHSWEEHGWQTASPAAPQPCHAAGPGGKAILGGEGTGTDLHMRDLHF